MKIEEEKVEAAPDEPRLSQSNRREPVVEEAKNTFVKTEGEQLLVLVNSNTEGFSNFENVLSEIEAFKAQIKIFSTNAEALQFLQQVREPDGLT